MATARSALQGGAFSKWVSGQSYAADTIVWSPISYLNYIRLGAGGATATDPSADDTNWAVFGPTRRKSLQVVDVTIAGGALTGTASITATVVAKTRLTHLGSSIVNASTVLGDQEGRLSQTSTTVITATRASNGSQALIVRCQVEEDW